MSWRKCAADNSDHIDCHEEGVVSIALAISMSSGKQKADGHTAGASLIARLLNILSIIQPTTP